MALYAQELTKYKQLAYASTHQAGNYRKTIATWLSIAVVTCMFFLAGVLLLTPLQKLPRIISLLVNTIAPALTPLLAAPEILQIMHQATPQDWREDFKSVNKVFVVLVSSLIVTMLLLTMVLVFTHFNNGSAVSTNPSPSSAQQSAPAHSTQPAPQDCRSHYTVQSGDNLYAIAIAFYHDRSEKAWDKIYKANISKISNPTLIHPGDVLCIPPN